MMMLMPPRLFIILNDCADGVDSSYCSRTGVGVGSGSVRAAAAAAAAAGITISFCTITKRANIAVINEAHSAAVINIRSTFIFIF